MKRQSPTLGWYLVTLIGCCLLLATKASASDENGHFAIRGAGLLTCQTYSKERQIESDAYKMMGGWLDGYLTAFNELSPDTFDVAPNESTELIAVLVERHCKNNPSDLVYSVSAKLVRNLYASRLPAAAEFVDIRVGEKQTRIYDNTVVRIQSTLSKQGFLTEPPSGNWNFATQSALASYQMSIGMDGTGFPDQRTLWNLLRSG